MFDIIVIEKDKCKNNTTFTSKINIVQQGGNSLKIFHYI
jgi:hypothetical protein